MDITLFTLIIYLIIMFSVAWFFSRKQSLGSYFLNKKKTSLWLMVFSNVTTIVGAGATVGIVSEVYNSGVSYGLTLPISFIFGMFILGFVAKKIKTIGDEYDAHTIVDFFYKRFDKKTGILTAILQLFLITIWIGMQALAIAALASVLIGVEFQVALLLAAVVTITYTAIGGLKVDIITDFIQFWIILGVFIVAAVFGYGYVGSFSNMLSQLPQGHLDPFAFGGISWFVGAILFSGFLYLGNTSNWQRIFSAENEAVAKNSFFWAMPFILLLSMLMLFFGLIAAITLSGINQDKAIFSLMNVILPPSLVGIGFAALLAVTMSSIDSMLIGGSTIIHRVIFKQKNLNSTKELLYAKIITVLFGIFGFIAAYFIPSIVTLSLIVTYLALIFVPPIFAGIYSQKISANASFYAILIPSILLFTLYSFMGENTFIITTPIGILIILLYDKIIKIK